VKKDKSTSGVARAVLLFGTRRGIAKTQAVLLLVVIAVAAGAGAYYLSTQGTTGNSQDITMNVVETDPARQIDSLVPQNVSVKQGTVVTLAVYDGDDEDRVVSIVAFNVNFTIQAGTTARSPPFTADKVGTFVVFSPQTKPSAASNGKPGSPVTGYLTVIPPS
jgi:hypothetical protein